MTKAELVRRMRSRAEQLPWLLNLTQIIQVSPGSGHQGLHRDDGVFAWDHSVLGNLEYELSTIWALHEFTAEIGATRVVPGKDIRETTRAFPFFELTAVSCMTKRVTTVFQDRLGTMRRKLGG
jgi:hypothetical protein